MTKLCRISPGIIPGLLNVCLHDFIRLHYGDHLGQVRRGLSLLIIVVVHRKTGAGKVTHKVLYSVTRLVDRAVVK